MTPNASLHRLLYRMVQIVIPLFGVAVIIWYVWFTQLSSNALFMAAANSDAPQVKAVLARGIPVDSRDLLGKSTALIMTANSPGNVEICRILLDKGADVNAKNVFGNTALILAASSGRTGVVRLLLSRGADVNAANNRGRSALYNARREGHADIAEILKQAGAKQ